MSASYAIIDRWQSLLLYKENKEKYVASCEMTILGNIATIYSLKGEEFYSLLLELEFKPFKDLGLVAIRAAMTTSHLRLLKRSLKGIAEVIDVRESIVSGHKLREVEIKLV